MAIVTFNETQKAAIVSLLIEMMVAIDIMKRMSDIQKITTAQLLTRVIDADAKDDDREIMLFNTICKITGVDVLVNARDGGEE